MKKFITLLLLTLTAFTYQSQAQNPNCTAAFSFAVTGNLTAHFSPVQFDSPYTHHIWNFGDQSANSTSISPSHTYAAAGTYHVKHVIRRELSGLSPCSDSVILDVHLVVPPCNISAHFMTSGAINSWNTVYFTNTSSGTIFSSQWHFGDGTSATTFNAYHNYANAGTYNVCLIVSGDGTCSDTTCRAVVVVAPTPCLLHANFSYVRDSAHQNKVYFTNLSTPITDVHSSRWSFGDGTFSYDFNTNHTYATSGLYHVCLLVRRDSTCQNEFCTDVQVQAPPPPSCNLVANFTSFTDSVFLNKVHFTNLSVPLSPGDSIRWTFGDGHISTDVNPVHEYNAAGTYTVCLRVKKNVTGATIFCIKEICKQVVVQQSCILHADFNSHADLLNSLKIYFINASTPATAVTYVQWTFGDGTSSSSWSPDHTYAQPGTYEVCLHLSSGGGCYSTLCKQVVVVEPINCQDLSKFTFTHSTANCLEFHFTPDHLNTNWQYHWTFGDGTASNTPIASHVYAQSGNYTVCLSVTRSLSCASTSCKPISTGLCFSCSNVWAKFTYVRDPNMPNKLYFHGQSNYPITGQTWTFTRISPASTLPPVILNQVDPTYVFPEPGYYRVCLRAVTYGGCVKEYCELIYISQFTSACTLTSYPNPAHTTISVNVVETTPDIIHVSIYNSLNIIVAHKDQAGSVGSNIVTINVEQLLPGTYTMRVVYGTHVCYSQFQKI